MSERKSKRRKTGEQPEGKTITDPRFANIQSDPRYRLPSKKHKVKVDKRFSRALKEDDFNRRAKVDRYGRPLETNSERKRLKRKYDFEDDESGSEENDRADDDEEVHKELNRVQFKPRDVLREGLDSDSSSSSGSSSEDETSEEDVEEEAELAPQTKNEVPTGEVSSRLAVVNLDWDNIRAQDLMAVFSSDGFLPAHGKLLKVTVYPSEFGKQRMAREEMEGPPPEIFAKSSKRKGESVSDLSDSEEEDDEKIREDILAPDDGTLDFDSTALRNYQLERLRYFYAILIFSSATAAKVIYDAVDGTEYLSTANFFDLRFVPDEVSFDGDEPREECTTIPTDYKPNEFVTDALRHSKVKLTWDAEDGGRKEAQARAFRGGRKELDENDLKAYLGTDSSSASEDEDDEGEVASTKKEAERQKMRSLLGLAAEPVKSNKKKDNAPVGGIQVTFSAGLSGNADSKKRSVFENSPEPEETTVEKYARKEKERKQKRKERMKSNRNEDPAQKEPEKDAEDLDAKEAELGFDDPFFAEPSHDKSASNKIRKEERLKKKTEREKEEENERKQRAELELLMRDDASSESETGKPKKRGVRHFDMREIEKAEKVKTKEDRRKAKKGKKSKRDDPEVAVEAEVDSFKLDTSDPRFASLFENHEYAIDPTNPRYKGTKGMEALLEEGRKRKGKKGGKSKTIDEPPKGNDDFSDLVEKIKKRKA